MIDSTSVTNVIHGNLALRSAVTRNVVLSYQYEDQSRKNSLNYYLGLTLNYIDNNIIDSVLISDDNRRNIFPTNDFQTNQNFNLNANIRKAIKLKTAELQLIMNGIIGKSKTGTYLNGAYAFSKNLNATAKITANFTYKDKVAIETSQSYSVYSLKQTVFKTKFSGAQSTTNLSSSYRLSKKITINSDITLNRNISTNIATFNFTLWNASASFRFLKGNNLELKFSALDLLRQNSNVVNYSNSTYFTVGTKNVLQNYFMTTLSYYPRKFGKNSKKK